MSVTPIHNNRAPAGRVPPHNIEAEQALLGAMLYTPGAIDDTADQLGADAFYKPAHGHIYQAIGELHGSGEAVDAITVADHLARHGLLETAGGRQGLSDLLNSATTAGSAGRHARIVAELHLLRRLIGIAAEISEVGYSVPTDVHAALDQAEQHLYDLRNDETSDTHSQPMSEVLAEWLDHLEAAYNRGEAGTPTGWADLDALLGSLGPSRLIVAAGRPGMGKSSWAGQLALNVARAARQVLFVTVEMSKIELAGRMVANESKLNSHHLSRGIVADNDWHRISKAVGTLAELPIETHDVTTATLATVRATARRLQHRTGRLDLIIVDYLQLMTGSTGGRKDNRQVEVAELARGLKLVARDFKVPVVALAQLSRDLESRRDKRPVLSDLRESGEIENSADQVLFIYRDEMYDPKPENQGLAELICAKNRHGPQGTVHLFSDLTVGRWSNIARPEQGGLI